MHLFLDTTFGVTVGLLDKHFDWVDYNFSLEKKSSTIIHSLINQILIDENLTVDKLSSIIMVAGPGSYTGMRVSKGITDVFEWQNLKVYSFYQFEVPTLLNMEKGLWFSDAFKGEYFFYEFNGENTKKYLLKKEDGNIKLQKTDVPIFVGRNKDEQSYSETQLLIKENSKKLFKKVTDNKIKRKLFYYRELDQEFSKAKSL
jgi:tRNA threonylcarbamoyladenosine biosynthesis protein TsaB